MLTELRVRDLAVIADVTLPFQPGLNVLTGETGAGKSMVVDALALLLGERASADVVRPGAEKTVVEGAFEFTSAIHRHLLPPFAALGIELEDAVDSSGLSKAHRILASLLRVDPSLAKWQELLDAAVASAAELAQAARSYASEIEADPERLTAVEQRRDLLFRLQQKHGPTIPDVLAARDSAARELELLDTADLDLRNIAAEREQAAAELERATDALTVKRTAGAKKLGRAVNKHLPALGMEGGRFEASLVRRMPHAAHGAEDVAFLVKLNEGMESRPLARVASGGELSRLML